MLITALRKLTWRGEETGEREETQSGLDVWGEGKQEGRGDEAIGGEGTRREDEERIEN